MNLFSVQKREQWKEIDKYVKEKFDVARSKRLAVKDSNLQQWALEKNHEINFDHLTKRF